MQKYFSPPLFYQKPQYYFLNYSSFFELFLIEKVKVSYYLMQGIKSSCYLSSILYIQRLFVPMSLFHA